MSNLLTFSFWFNLRPPSLSPLSVKIFLVIVLLFLVCAIICKITHKKKGGLYAFVYRKLSTCFFTSFVIGALLLFFNYENIPALSARFLIPLWLLGIIIWAGFILLKIKEVPKRKESLEQNKEYRKYIP